MNQTFNFENSLTKKILELLGDPTKEKDDKGFPIRRIKDVTILLKAENRGAVTITVSEYSKNRFETPTDVEFTFQIPDNADSKYCRLMTLDEVLETEKDPDSSVWLVSSTERIKHV